MVTTPYTYTTVEPDAPTRPAPQSEESLIDPPALVKMRELSAARPTIRWAAAQCVDLGSRNLGHLRFIAIGPDCETKQVTDKRLSHWSYYFVGWVNLETADIQPLVP